MIPPRPPRPITAALFLCCGYGLLANVCPGRADPAPALPGAPGTHSLAPWPGGRWQRLAVGKEKNKPRVKPIKVRLGLGRIMVRGSLDKSLIRRVILRNSLGLKDCYRGVLGKKPRLQGRLVLEFWIAATGRELQGRLVLEFWIAATGRVFNPKVRQSTLSSSTLSACLKHEASRWVFPRTRSGIMFVGQPLSFRRK